MNKKVWLLFTSFISLHLFAQEAIEYKTPPKEIYDLVMAKPTPSVSIENTGNWMLIMELILSLHQVIVSPEMPQQVPESAPICCTTS